MSRVGKMPIAVPQGVDVSLSADSITVKGSNGTLVRAINPLVTVTNDAGKLSFKPANDSAEADAMSGTMRALVASMVGGVSKGFEKKLSLVGVGFRAQAQGQKQMCIRDSNWPARPSCWLRPSCRCAAPSWRARSEAEA